jgi:AmmeMemoRadiSam system protein A
MIDHRDERAALAWVRATIAARLGGPEPEPPDGAFFATPAANFVTLFQGARLQGCIGDLAPTEPLSASLARNALLAAFDDPRNHPLSLAMVPTLTVELSLLSPFAPLSFASEEQARAQLRPGVDGLVLRWHQHRGVFLPQVWRSLETPREFLDHLKVKAGLSMSFWAPDVALERFTVHEFYDGPSPPR